ncbi:hypothetical protein Tco_0410273 [Tanacetum coccineum]
MVKPVWNNDQRMNHQIFTKKTHPYAKRNMVPRAVLMKSGLVSINTARQVNAAHLKTTVNAARPMPYLSKTIQVSDGLGPQKKLIFLSNVLDNPQMDLQAPNVLEKWEVNQTTTRVRVVFEQVVLVVGKREHKCKPYSPPSLSMW